MTARSLETTRRHAFVTGFAGVMGAALAALVLYILFRFLDAAVAISSPFVAAGAFALLLDPLVDRVQKHVRVTQGRRGPAVALVFVLFVLVFAALLIVVMPNLIEQIQRVVAWVSDAGPARLQEQVDSWLSEHRRVGSVHLPQSVNDIISQYSGQITDAVKSSATRVAGVIVSSVSGLLVTVLVPIITFYLLMDLDRLKARILFLLPERPRRLFLVTTQDIGAVFGGYIRGMIQVSLAYMVTAVLVLLLLSLVPAMAPLRGYALLIGVVGGLLYVVPYVGFLGVALLTVTVGLAAGAPMIAIGGYVAALAILNTVVFDNIITPRIAGAGVGLHPILSMFALLMGAALFGLWGMLIAVPIAGSIQAVLMRLFPILREATEPSLTVPPPVRIHAEVAADPIDKAPSEEIH